MGEDVTPPKIPASKLVTGAIAYPVEKLGSLKAYIMRKKLKYRTIFILRADGRLEEYLVKPKTGEAKIKVKGMVRVLQPDGWFIHKKLGPVAVYPEYSPDPITRDRIKLEGAITGQLLSSLITEAYQLGRSTAEDAFIKEIKTMQYVIIGLVAVVAYLVYSGNTQMDHAIRQLADAIRQQAQILQQLTP